MGKAIYLDVADRKVLTTQITYDDLVILYKQYIEKYGEVPTFSKCNSKHNMPQGRIINRVISEKGITYNDFLLQFGITTRLSIEQQKHIFDNIYNSFPMNIHGTTFYINNIELSKKSDKKHNKYIVDMYDEYGYKYKINYDSVIACIRNGSQLNRFFKRNPYTYDNINLYCKLNNIDLYINGNGLPVSGYARELLNFYDSNGNIVKTSWNYISNHKIKCETQEDAVKLKNKMYMSKEQAIPIILARAEELQRPLLQRDFEGVETTENTIGIRVIWRIWGNFGNMIKELGLPEHDYFYKPFDKNYKPHEEILDDIRIVCEKVKSEDRNIVMYSDFKKLFDLELSTIRRHCELENTTLNEIVKMYGCELQQCGNGMNHTFNDGEKVVSRYEYDFSNFLRNNGFEYNKSYFRNIYYSNFDEEYDGNMNCDYCIDFNGQLVYIELAGILGNKQHQDAYRNNIPIKSKSKEEYRQKLNQKREIFERNNLEYYILLPDEMNEDTYKNILKKYLKEVA